jgi:hypothetical protein
MVEFLGWGSNPSELLENPSEILESSLTRQSLALTHQSSKKLPHDIGMKACDRVLAYTLYTRKKQCEIMGMVGGGDELKMWSEPTPDKPLINLDKTLINPIICTSNTQRANLNI